MLSIRPSHPFLGLAQALILSILILLPARVQTAAEPAEVIKKVQEKYSRAGSFTARFLQETKHSGTRAGERASGTLYFQKPARMRWQYENPPDQRKEVICDGHQVWIYVPEDALALVYPIRQVLRSDLVLRFFSDLSAITRDFRISWQQPPMPGESLKIRLEPREPQPELSRLLLTINPHSYLVEHLEFANSLGEESRFAFSQTTLGIKLPPGFFTFTPPPGVQIVREVPEHR